VNASAPIARWSRTAGTSVGGAVGAGVGGAAVGLAAGDGLPSGDDAAVVGEGAFAPNGNEHATVRATVAESAT
ncbi:MAG TPA: hypothetical protein VFV20_07335, partial [Candidatus Limnocylindria bacterium]|nr:hypothetical protein [Candidatus Limnocylindria bacterium]